MDIQKNARDIKAKLESLADGEKTRVPWGTYLFFKGFYTQDMRGTKSALVNPFASMVLSSVIDRPKARFATPEEAPAVLP